MKNKKNIIIVSIVFILIVVIGSAYAWFNFSKEGGENKLVTGNLYLLLEQGNDTISLTNVFPMSDEEAREQTDNILTFSISGTNTSNKLLYYEILLGEGVEQVGKTRFNDNDLKFDLVKIDNNVRTTLVDAGTYQDINETFMYGEVFGTGISTEKTINYELRMWISDSVIISDTDPNATYPATGTNAYKNHYASVKVAVVGEFGNVVGRLTYNEDSPVYQDIYEGKKIILASPVDTTGFLGWATEEGGDVVYQPGDVITASQDTTLYPVYKETFQGKIMKLCNDTNVAYVQKYNKANGDPIDTPDGSGSEDVCYYTTTSTNRNSDAEQNSNVIFGNYCWLIVRTTADGGVKLLYNGPKTTDNKCPSDADTENYSSNPRPSTIGVVGTDGTQYTTMTGNKIYGTSFEIFSEGGTNKFRLLDTNTYSWSDSTYKNLIGKYVCGTSSSPTGTDTACEVLYYVGHYQSVTQANTENYTIGTNSHYSQIGTSSYNAYYDSPALVGYMYNDVYLFKSKSFSLLGSDVINRQSSPSAYYYGDEISWDGTYYHLIDSSTNQEPTTTSTWVDIRGNVGGKYTCKSSNATTGTKCTTVYYIVANSTDSYMYSVPLSNNENKDKTVTWTYGTGITKSGNTYTLTETDTITFKLADWYTDYADSKYKNIYVCDDFTSTTCTTARFITSTTNYNEAHDLLNYTYYFANDINYDSNTNTYSYDTNETVLEIYDWRKQYNTINNTHYMCENYDSINNTCGANNPIYYINYTNTAYMYYAILEGVPNIDAALVNMLSKDTTENNQVVTVNKYNSAIKGTIDSWYASNLLSLSSYLDNDAVYCNDRTITSYGGWSKTGSTTDNYSLRFKYYSNPSKTNATLSCANMTDRFSKTNEKALLTYPVGLLSEAERAMMYQGYAKTGQIWWLGSPRAFYSNYARGCYVSPSGSYNSNNVSYSNGVRPVIVLKPGTEITGNGTYDEPYVVKTN